MTASVHPAVETTDLANIYAYIARDDPDAGRRVVRAARRTFDDLAGQPEIGRVYRTGLRGLTGVRVEHVRGYPVYLVFYKPEPESVRILYVLHSARDIPKLMRQDPRA